VVPTSDMDESAHTAVKPCILAEMQPCRTPELHFFLVQSTSAIQSDLCETEQLWSLCAINHGALWSMIRGDGVEKGHPLNTYEQKDMYIIVNLHVLVPEDSVQELKPYFFH
jgi:hypothetical protein